MSISITCRGCGTKYKVADAAAGKKVKCKKCGGVMAIPALVPPASGDSGLALRFRDDEPAAPAPAPTAPKPARPAAAKPAARPAAAPTRSAPAAARSKPAAARRPAPPPAPPAEPEENSLDDLAALAHGDPLPMEDLPVAAAAPVHYQPPAAAAPVRGRSSTAPLGYASRPAVLEQPAYIHQYGGMLIAATFLAPVINTIIRLFIVLGHVPPGARINYGAVAVGMVIGMGISAVALCFVAAILLVGIKVAGAIMKFSTEPGGFRNVLMIMGLPAVLGLLNVALSVVLPEGALEIRIVIALLVLALGLAGMVKLLKDSFVLTWAQTAVAAAMAIGSVIAVIVLIVLAVAGIGGLSLMKYMK